MKTYSSGNPRIYTSQSEQKIKDTIKEYLRFGIRNPFDPLTPKLLDCACDLQDELKIRAERNG